MTKTKTRLPFGDRVLKVRKEKGLSQERLAEMAGTTRRHIIRIEQNDNVPRKALRERLVEALGNPHELVGSDEDEEADPLRSLSLDEFLRLKVQQIFHEERERLVATQQMVA